MLISHDWLRSFVPHDLPPDAVRELISAHVATVDGAEPLRSDLGAIVIARVTEAGPHPNSDHLWVTKVDDGSGQLLDVVCGAPNVTVGTLYPFARSGTTLPGGTRIEKRKIRGETSNGMLCSARELGLGDEHEGIMALDLDVAPGTSFLAAVPVGDVRFDVDVLPNRPDLLSHLGMAREIAALTGTSLGDPADAFPLGPSPDGTPAGDAIGGDESSVARSSRPTVSRADNGAADPATVILEDTEGCPRYMAVVVRGVTIGPSPDWLVRRLDSVGVRPISNVVDATNYMLHGYGQPMHAFDLARLAASTIIVRRARPGESIVTLDGVERRLDESMTVIADAERAVAVAGVMGGRDSEVTAGTTDLLLEVAYFAPPRVRSTRRTLGLSTDASYRYERGIDPELAAPALQLAARLITGVAGGRVDGTAIDVGAPPARRVPVSLTPARVQHLLGDRVSLQEIGRLLSSVGFQVATEGDALRVSSPSWRVDVARDADLVEEVARLRGYDALPDELRPFRPGTVPDHPYVATTRRVRDALVGLGLFEVRPLPFVRGSDETHVRVRNPLADDEPHLRVSLLETLARRAEYNLTRMQGDVRLFEIGSAFARAEGALPSEEFRAALLVMGSRRPHHFTDSGRAVYDEWDAQAMGSRLASLVHPGRSIRLEPGSGDPVLWSVRDVSSGAELGVVRRVALDAPVWASAAFGVEVAIGAMFNAPVAPAGEHDYSKGAGSAIPGAARSPYCPLATTPVAEFDLALVVPDSLAAGQVETLIRRSGGELLESLELFDEFRGPGLPDGSRSLAWRLTFRDPTRTLRDKEVEGRRTKILRTLETELGVRPRSA